MGYSLRQNGRPRRAAANYPGVSNLEVISGHLIPSK